MGESKRCSKCDKVKDLSEFCFRKDTQKYRNQCRDCIKLIIKENKTINKDEIKLQRKKYGEKTKNLKRLYDIDYRERNREKIQLHRKNYFQNFKGEMYKEIKKRKDEDNYFRLAYYLRKRVLNAFKAQNNRKTKKNFRSTRTFTFFFKAMD